MGNNLGQKTANFAAKIQSGVFWFKLGAWILFATAGPAVFALMRNFLGMFILGLISAVMGYFFFKPHRLAFRGSGILKRFLILQGILSAAYGGYVLFSPTAPWQHVTGKTRTSLVITKTGVVYGVEFTTKSANFLRFDPLKNAWQSEAFPGRAVVRIFLSPDEKQIIAPEDRSRKVWYFENNKWQSRTDAQRLRRKDIDCLSTGADVPFTPDLCHNSGPETTWLASSGLFSGKFAVRSGTGAYTLVDSPVPRPEAMFGNKSDPNELWAAFWGSGVYRTRDAGKSWQYMGLRGSEVTSLVVDFERKVAYASTGSGIFRLDMR